jgi:hypothetical protein
LGSFSVKFYAIVPVRNRGIQRTEWLAMRRANIPCKCGFLGKKCLFLGFRRCAGVFGFLAPNRVKTAAVDEISGILLYPQGKLKIIFFCPGERSAPKKNSRRGRAPLAGKCAQGAAAREIKKAVTLAFWCCFR